ncbi:MAG TPA: response regulator transcription factor [Bacteroidota bacterium]|nr:response regulator transcription factor [Bacteroidota bacterium]
MISVCIVEDDPDIRESLAILIDGMPGFSCKQKFESAEEALKDIAINPPDVVLMDIQLPGINGIEAVRRLRDRNSEVDIIMLTVHEDEDSVFQSLCAGASGYLPKNTPPAKLLDAISEVRRGGSPMGANIARLVVKSFQTTHDPMLSEREYGVLDRLCKGDSYKEIAERLFISEETVRSHIKNIYRKLEVHSKAEAVAKALHSKIIR